MEHNAGRKKKIFVYWCRVFYHTVKWKWKQLKLINLQSKKKEFEDMFLLQSTYLVEVKFELFIGN